MPGFFAGHDIFGWKNGTKDRHPLIPAKAGIQQER